MVYFNFINCKNYTLYSLNLNSIYYYFQFNNAPDSSGAPSLLYYCISSSFFTIVLIYFSGKFLHIKSEFYYCLCAYFCFVAMPPLRCLSLLFTASTFLTPSARSASIAGSLSSSVKSLCTVDLLMPNAFAAWRTVALFSIMYWATSIALCSI